MKKQNDGKPMVGNYSSEVLKRTKCKKKKKKKKKTVVDNKYKHRQDIECIVGEDEKWINRNCTQKV